MHRRLNCILHSRRFLSVGSRSILSVMAIFQHLGQFAKVIKPLQIREAPIRIQLLVFGFTARTTRVGVMNRKFGNQRVIWFHPRRRRISAY